MKRAILSLLAVYTIHISAFTKCIRTSFQSPTQCANKNFIGVYDFISTNNSQASGNSRAHAASLLAILSGNTSYLKVTGFNSAYLLKLLSVASQYMTLKKE